MLKDKNGKLGNRQRHVCKNEYGFTWISIVNVLYYSS